MNNFKKELVATIGLIILLLISAMLSGCIGVFKYSGKPRLIQTGSSTLLPLAIAWAEEYNGADIMVSGGGSSHGFNALLNGEADLGDASRLLKGSDYEKVRGSAGDINPNGTAKKAAPTGVWPHKWTVAYDALVIVVNKKNNWATKLNYSQLYKIFTTDHPAIYWDEVPDLINAPHEKIEIYAPDEASGTFDFFFEEIIPNWGKDDQKTNPRLNSNEGVYHPSADDNVILSAVRYNKYAIGYFGFAYYNENPGAVNPVWVADDDDNFIEPSLANVTDYSLARPLYIYTDGVPKNGSAVNNYLKYILSKKGQNIIPEVGYIKLDLVDPNLILKQLIKIESIDTRTIDDL